MEAGASPTKRPSTSNIASRHPAVCQGWPTVPGPCCAPHIDSAFIRPVSHSRRGPITGRSTTSAVSSELFCGVTNRLHCAIVTLCRLDFIANGRHLMGVAISAVCRLRYTQSQYLELSLDTRHAFVFISVTRKSIAMFGRRNENTGNLSALCVKATRQNQLPTGWGGRVIILLASHQGKPGSIPGRVTGFSQVGIVPDDAVGRSEVDMEQRRNERAGGGGNSEKTRQPAALYGTIPTCGNPGVTQPGIERVPPWWEASSLTAHPPQPLLTEYEQFVSVSLPSDDIFSGPVSLLATCCSCRADSALSGCRCNDPCHDSWRRLSRSPKANDIATRRTKDSIRRLPINNTIKRRTQFGTRWARITSRNERRSEKDEVMKLNTARHAQATEMRAEDSDLQIGYRAKWHGGRPSVSHSGGPVFESLSAYCDFGYPWFPEITPRECWVGSLIQTIHSWSIPCSSEHGRNQPEVAPCTMCAGRFLNTSRIKDVSPDTPAECPGATSRPVQLHQLRSCSYQVVHSNTLPRACLRSRRIASVDRSFCSTEVARRTRWSAHRRPSFSNAPGTYGHSRRPADTKARSGFYSRDDPGPERSLRIETRASLKMVSRRLAQWLPISDNETGEAGHLDEWRIVVREEILNALDIEVFGADKGDRDEVGETGDLRKNPPTNGIVRHDSHMRKSGVIRPGIEPGSPWEANRPATVASGKLYAVKYIKTYKLMYYDLTLYLSEREEKEGSGGVTAYPLNAELTRARRQSATWPPESEGKGLMANTSHFLPASAHSHHGQTA
ncbi:hypothetical protein PR048_028498 [Dryococelus australis]|uniref:Uncharacterized protein n=1 Tax=Dryococelus australis TaxID=614101 RepID=A0ABQ9GBF3_9NEOP|nr:hypothetical protein PR048_028498 [Dryococelus australis]